MRTQRDVQAALANTGHAGASAATAPANASAPTVGDLLRVTGRITSYCDQVQLNCTSYGAHGRPALGGATLTRSPGVQRCALTHTLSSCTGLTLRGCARWRDRHRAASTRSTVSTMATVCESNSMFTTSPTALCPNVVARSVSGMSHTQNVSGVTSPTVKLHPSTAMKPCAGKHVSSSAKRRGGCVEAQAPSVAHLWKDVFHERLRHLEHNLAI